MLKVTESVSICLSCIAVLQLCYNKLSGNVPTQIGSLKKLNVLALQYNQLTGAIPASLGGLDMLTRLDLSFNKFFGPIPVRLAEAPLLRILDVRNNTLSGNVPAGNLNFNSIYFSKGLLNRLAVEFGKAWN